MRDTKSDRSNGRDITFKYQAHFETDQDIIIEEAGETSVNVKNRDEANMESEVTSAEVDDEIEIIKADIYRYQGDKSYSQEVKEDVFKFQYLDDEDDIVILDDDKEDEDEEELKETNSEDLKTLMKCEECDDLLDEKDLEGHMMINHPVEVKEIKQFGDGNFFMMV